MKYTRVCDSSVPQGIGYNGVFTLDVDLYSGRWSVFSELAPVTLFTQHALFTNI